MKYRKLNKYKYQLIEDSLLIKHRYDFPYVGTSWIEIDSSGILIECGYCWDGATCAIDTKDFMIASLVHDALYQLIRLKKIDIKYRKIADEILKDLCLLYGMKKLRANYIYWAVRLFGSKFLNIGEEQDIIYEIKEK